MSFIRWVLSDGGQGWKTGVDVYLGEESVGRWNGLYHVWGFWAQWLDRYQCKYIVHFYLESLKWWSVFDSNFGDWI